MAFKSYISAGQVTPPTEATVVGPTKKIRKLLPRAKKYFAYQKFTALFTLLLKVSMDKTHVLPFEKTIKIVLKILSVFFHFTSLGRFLYLFFSPKKQQKTVIFCIEGLISLFIVALDVLTILLLLFLANNKQISLILEIAAVVIIIVKFGPLDYKAGPLLKEMLREIVSGEPTDEGSSGSSSSTFVAAPAWSPSASPTGQAAVAYPNQSRQRPVVSQQLAPKPAHEPKGSVSPNSCRSIDGTSLVLVPERPVSVNGSQAQVSPFRKPKKSKGTEESHSKGKKGRY